MSDGLLTVAEIAADRGWDRTTAWRWLRRLEREYGARLVRDPRTRSLCIGRIEFARVSALVVAAKKKNADPQIQTILERLDELEARQNGLAREVATLRKTV